MHRLLATIALLAITAVGTSGCMTHTYYTDSNVMPTEVPTYEDKFNSHFVFGLVTPASAQVDIADICPDGVRYVRDRVSFVNGLVGMLTFNIYSPSQVKVWCN